jgi:hypothetical protein
LQVIISTELSWFSLIKGSHLKSAGIINDTNYKAEMWGYLQCHGVHTMFYENLSTGPKVEDIYIHIHGHDNVINLSFHTSKENWLITIIKRSNIFSKRVLSYFVLLDLYVIYFGYKYSVAKLINYILQENSLVRRENIKM